MPTVCCEITPSSTPSTNTHYNHAVTHSFQTTTQDISAFPFLPRRYHMTHVLQLPFINTVWTPVVLANHVKNVYDDADDDDISQKTKRISCKPTSCRRNTRTSCRWFLGPFRSFLHRSYSDLFCRPSIKMWKLTSTYDCVVVVATGRGAGY